MWLLSLTISAEQKTSCWSFFNLLLLLLRGSNVGWLDWETTPVVASWLHPTYSPCLASCCCLPVLLRLLDGWWRRPSFLHPNVIGVIPVGSRSCSHIQQSEGVSKYDLHIYLNYCRAFICKKKLRREVIHIIYYKYVIKLKFDLSPCLLIQINIT